MRLIRNFPSFLLILFLLILTTGCAPRYTTKGVDSKNITTDKPETGTTVEGIASFYSYEFANRKTANGEIFDPEGLTAAHRQWPFGTMVEVTSIKTGKTVVVRINDRGPFTDCIIDLAYGAAKKIGMKENTPVRLKVISTGDGK